MNSRRMIYIGVAVALVALWLFGLYLPTVKQKQQLTSKISEARTQLDDFNLTLSQLPLFIKTRQDLEAKLVDANSHLYAKSDLLRLFDNLKDHASANGLRVIEITPPVHELLELNKAMPGSSEPLFLTIGVSLDGNYLNFGRFVEAIEREPYFRTVKSCTVTSLADGSGRVTYMVGFKALLGGVPEEA